MVRTAALPCLLAAACVPEGPATGHEETLPETVLTPIDEEEAPVVTRFIDRFDRTELGDEWLSLSPAWKIESGRLCAANAKNQGVWLKQRLPKDVRVELDAYAGSVEGDLKVEIFGDGRSGASGDSYDDATSYIAILGGWRNTTHVLAKKDEHDPNRLEIAVDSHGDDARARSVVPDQPYHFVLERKRGVLAWSVNGTKYFELKDPEPLEGPGHGHFAFNDWAAPVCFDNLEIGPA
jgi:hypothetical protein